MKLKKRIKLFLSSIILCIAGYVTYNYEEIRKYFEKYNSVNITENLKKPFVSYNKDQIPEYQKDDYIILNNNIPDFEDDDYSLDSFEFYSDLDSLGRCGVTVANISKDLMPTEERGSIGQIKPTGWQTVKYDIVDGKYLYNRCHLIGYQLTGENANPKNLITCTRYMNTNLMTQFENKVAEYIKRTNNHVLYRVTPLFENDNLLAKGVQIEAKSIEDDEICFNVFIYNIQKGIKINYKTGESYLDK